VDRAWRAFMAAMHVMLCGRYREKFFLPCGGQRPRVQSHNRATCGDRSIHTRSPHRTLTWYEWMDRSMVATTMLLPTFATPTAGDSSSMTKPVTSPFYSTRAEVSDTVSQRRQVASGGATATAEQSRAEQSRAERSPTRP
jgi:hypothetical protein